MQSVIQLTSESSLPPFVFLLCITIGTTIGFRHILRTVVTRAESEVNCLKIIVFDFSTRLAVRTAASMSGVP